MKMFKRFAAAFLAGVMALAMLTACGGGAGGNSSNEIESKVLKYLNTVNGTSYSNNADLQSKVRAVLAKTDDTFFATGLQAEKSCCASARQLFGQNFILRTPQRGFRGSH